MAVLKHVWLCMSLLQFGVQAVLGLMMFEWQQMAFMTMTNWHPVLELQHWFFDFTTLYPTQCHMYVDVLPRLSLLRCCSNAILHRTVVNAWQDGRNRKGGNDVSSSQKQPSMILKYINVALFLIFNWFETKKNLGAEKSVSGLGSRTHPHLQHWFLWGNWFFWVIFQIQFSETVS